MPKLPATVAQHVAHPVVGKVIGMPWPKTGATHYHAHLGLLRQRSCNQRVGCLMGVDTLGD